MHTLCGQLVLGLTINSHIHPLIADPDYDCFYIPYWHITDQLLNMLKLKRDFRIGDLYFC